MPGARVVTEPVVGFRANLPLTVTRRWARTALWFEPSARSRPGIFRQRALARTYSDSRVSSSEHSFGDQAVDAVQTFLNREVAILLEVAAQWVCVFDGRAGARAVFRPETRHGNLLSGMHRH